MNHKTINKIAIGLLLITSLDAHAVIKVRGNSIPEPNRYPYVWKPTIVTQIYGYSGDLTLGLGVRNSRMFADAFGGLLQGKAYSYRTYTVRAGNYWHLGKQMNAYTAGSSIFINKLCSLLAIDIGIAGFLDEIEGFAGISMTSKELVKYSDLKSGAIFDTSPSLNIGIRLLLP